MTLGQLANPHDHQFLTSRNLCKYRHSAPFKVGNCIPSTSEYTRERTNKERLYVYTTLLYGYVCIHPAGFAGTILSGCEKKILGCSSYDNGVEPKGRYDATVRSTNAAPVTQTDRYEDGACERIKRIDVAWERSII